MNLPYLASTYGSRGRIMQVKKILWVENINLTCRKLRVNLASTNPYCHLYLVVSLSGQVWKSLSFSYWLLALFSCYRAHACTWCLVGFGWGSVSTQPSSYFEPAAVWPWWGGFQLYDGPWCGCEQHCCLLHDFVFQPFLGGMIYRSHDGHQCSYPKNQVGADWPPRASTTLVATYGSTLMLKSRSIQEWQLG